MDFDKLQIDILKDAIAGNRWQYWCEDGKVVLSPKHPFALFVVPHQEAKLVLERVAIRNEKMYKYYKLACDQETIGKMKKLNVLGSVKPYYFEHAMYKLADESNELFVHADPKWFKYCGDLLNVEMFSEDEQGPVVIMENGEVVALVAPFRIGNEWKLL